MSGITLLFLWTDGEHELAAQSVASLARTLPASPQIEVAFVDASTHPAASDRLAALLKPHLSAHPRWWIVRLDSLPIGLAALRNAAVAAARPSGGFLGFFSPGSVFLPGWFSTLLGVLKRAPRAGCVGNLHREPYSGLIDHAGLRFGPDGFPTLGASRILPPPDVFDRYPAVSLACAVLPRALFEQIGGFDPVFAGPLADVDFCLRAATTGSRHYVANRSVVYHAPEQAFATNADADLAAFRARWGGRAESASRRRSALQIAPPAHYLPEAWEMAREFRRLQRVKILADQRQGNRYLRKHWYRPWRYNYERVCRALVHSLTPPPAVLPLHPGGLLPPVTDTVRSDDGWLFEPPPQE